MYKMMTTSKHIAKTLILSLFAVLIFKPGFSQRIVSAEEFNPADSNEKGRLLSIYKEFFKAHLYDEAMDSWWTLFNEYPDASEKLYVDGVTMYRAFIKKTAEGPARTNKIDTLMLIYDHRMAHFGGEGNVLGRKGSDLLRYRKSEMDQVEAAYGMLKKSVDIQGIKSREAVLVNYISAGVQLHKAGMAENQQVMEDYFLVMEHLQPEEGESSRRKKSRASIEEMVHRQGILTCEGLDQYFSPQLEQGSGDKVLLENVIKAYTSAACKESDVYASASELMFKLEPGAESAHQLAVLFIGRNDLRKAADYLLMSVVDESIASETRAEWFYELSIVSLALGENCEAVAYAREALILNKEFGKAYMALGDAFVACREQLGDDFQQRSAYWAAADMYRTAANVDHSLVEESGEKLAMCVSQFPSSEDTFFQDLKEGSSYRVGGCIQENTTVRSRN